MSGVSRDKYVKGRLSRPSKFMSHSSSYCHATTAANEVHFQKGKEQLRKGKATRVNSHLILMSVSSLHLLLLEDPPAIFRPRSPLSEKADATSEVALERR